MRLTITDDLQRGRGSVFFRLWFALPFLLWLTLWGIAAFFVAIANWFATLFKGTSPRALHDFLARFVRFAVHTYAYLYLAAEPLPGFGGKPGYPIDVEIDPPVAAEPLEGRLPPRARRPGPDPPRRLLRHWGRLQRTSEAETGRLGLLVAAAFLGWFFALARARMPRGLRDLIAYGLSYAAQAWAYMPLLTDRYPSSDPLTAIGPLPARDDPIRLESSDDLRRNRLTVFFRLLLAIPHLIWLVLWGIAAFFAAIGNWFAILFTGISPAGLHRFLAAYTALSAARGRLPVRDRESVPRLHRRARQLPDRNPHRRARSAESLDGRLPPRAGAAGAAARHRLRVAPLSPSPCSAGSPRCSPARCRSACATPAPWPCATRSALRLSLPADRRLPLQRPQRRTAAADRRPQRRISATKRLRRLASRLARPSTLALLAGAVLWLWAA